MANAQYNPIERRVVASTYQCLTASFSGNIRWTILAVFVRHHQPNKNCNVMICWRREQIPNRYGIVFVDDVRCGPWLYSVHALWPGSPYLEFGKNFRRNWKYPMSIAMSRREKNDKMLLNVKLNVRKCRNHICTRTAMTAMSKTECFIWSSWKNKIIDTTTARVTIRSRQGMCGGGWEFVGKNCRNHLIKI